MKLRYLMRDDRQSTGLTPDWFSNKIGYNVVP